MQDTPQKNRTIMSIVAIVVGLLMVGVIPFIVQTALERVLSLASDNFCCRHRPDRHFASDQKRRRMDLSSGHGSFGTARNWRLFYVPALYQLG